ncbi:MAG: beta-hydroxyacyl-ACP dehydratase [Prevotella sp.]|nr:beta-hydroxyacyl-ACP dehydratase [Prevotella sp.]
MIIKGDDIKKLIPQREPFMMVDEFEQQDENTARTMLVVQRGNYFLLPDGMMSPTGLIEHIAQSCSALAASKAAGETAPIGMIAEVKHFCCHRRPEINEQLLTTVTFGFSFGQMTLAHGITTIGGETIAEVDLKIFMQ